MKKIVLLSALLFLLAAAGPAAAQSAGEFTLTGDDAFYTFDQDIPINLVFIGYDETQINERRMREILPQSYDPLVRLPRFYGLEGRDLGLHYEFDYRFVFADASFEDQLFNYLSDIGRKSAPTLYQMIYNDQATNVLDVTGAVLAIDAPATEAWLAANANLLGVDVAQSYTIFYVNWWGRDDFQFHVYSKTDEPDPDTGFNFGAALDSRKMIAWGGTHSRTWFHDLSAGPDWNTSNYIVDFKDLDGDGFRDYRMPPIWEYVDFGYRRPQLLSTDLALVARFAAIDLLFTPSPLYDPLVTAPGPDGDKIVHIEMFEGNPDSSGALLTDTDAIRDALAALQPYYPWQVNLDVNDPIPPDVERAFRIFSGQLAENDCWNLYGDTFAELFCYFDANFDQYVPTYAPDDYVAAVFAFNTTDQNAGNAFGLLGYADDNWTDGTQTYIFDFLTPFLNNFGYGFSITTIHEDGHHNGLSHPHDGYDSELDIDFGPGGSFYFAWVGDESDTVMSYLDVSGGFGQFNQDNIYRWETAGYLNWSLQLAQELRAHGDYRNYRSDVRAAAALADQAVAAFYEWDYLTAAERAWETYQTLARVADVLGIPTPNDEQARLAPTLSHAALQQKIEHRRYPLHELPAGAPVDALAALHYTPATDIDPLALLLGVPTAVQVDAVGVVSGASAMLPLLLVLVITLVTAGQFVRARRRS